MVAKLKLEQIDKHALFLLVKHTLSVKYNSDLRNKIAESRHLKQSMAITKTSARKLIAKYCYVNSEFINSELYSEINAIKKLERDLGNRHRHSLGS